MGLDMTLFCADEDVTLEDIFQKDIPQFYWRKANQIHNWFVKNVQGGEDDCGLYEVSRDQLKKLQEDVAYTLVTQDTYKLPTLAGFFFGTTEVDEWYWEDLKETAAYLKEALGYEDSTKFFYHSSW